MLKKILILILLNSALVACASSTAKKESPVVYFSNVSPQPIKNIHCDWKTNILSLPALNPGDSRSQSFYIKKDADFFGLVKVSWTNDKGEQVVKEFNFSNKNLPSMDDHTTYNYVQLYFDQEDIEIVSSDTADLGGKTRRMEQLLSIYRDQYTGAHPAAPRTSLIRVEPKKDTSIPGWLTNAY